MDIFADFFHPGSSEVQAIPHPAPDFPAFSSRALIFRWFPSGASMPVS
jgi:hypothetical protein